MGALASRRRALYGQVQSIVKKENLLSTLPSKFCAWKQYISSVERVFAGEDAGVPMAGWRSRGRPAFPWFAGVPMACRRALYGQVQSIVKKEKSPLNAAF